MLRKLHSEREDLDPNCEFTVLVPKIAKVVNLRCGDWRYKVDVGH